MSSYWAAVGVILVPLGAVLYYLVWNFLMNAQSLDEKYSTRIDEARDAIHDRKFVPIIASICDSVVAQKEILKTAPTVELLTQYSIRTRLRGEAVMVISERIALERSYEWAHRVSFWVAVPWLAFTILFAVLFVGHYDAQTGIKSLWVPSLAVPTIASAVVGCTTLGLYLMVLNRFLRLLRANPL